MSICPYRNESATCDLPPVEAGQRGEHAPTIAYCKQCAQVIFRCPSGHWNRAFARYCTQCPQKLEKPLQWDIASGNPQRTATFSTDSVDVNFGLNSGVVNTSPMETSENLPGLLVIDGLFILPNPNENRLEAYTIVNTENSIDLHHQWGIDFNTPLTYGSTPIYHGLHLYSLVSGGIQKTHVMSGRTELINTTSGMDTAQIEPLSGCAPLKCEVNGKSTMIAGVKQGVLLFDLSRHDAFHITDEDLFFEEENKPMSPTLCGTHVVFTSQKGQIFSLDIAERPYMSQVSRWGNISFSAPVTLGSLIYFEALEENGKRHLVWYEPISDELSEPVDLGIDTNLARRLSFFIHPTLTDGERLFFADRFGRNIYTYDSHQNRLTFKTLVSDGDLQPVLVPHRSVVVNNQIYSTHPAGLTVIRPDQDYTVSDQSLAMGWKDSPFPVAPPIHYGNELFVFCRDRLVCLDC